MLQHNVVKANEVIEGEIVDTNVKSSTVTADATVIHTKDYIQVMATIQIVVPDIEPSNNHDFINKQLSIIDSQHKEIIRLNKLLAKKRVVNPKFITTKHAALFIDVDPSFLTKRQGNVFKLGKHFFKPAGQSILRWDIEALCQWMMTEYDETLVDDELAELLERR